MATSFIEFQRTSQMMSPSLKFHPPSPPPPERNVAPRAQIGDHPMDEFAYPFECIGSEENMLYPPLKNHLIPVVTETIEPDNFPENIQRWIWSAAGANDEESWEAIFQLTDDEGGKR